jgi:hypothetical protein
MNELVRFKPVLCLLGGSERSQIHRLVKRNWVSNDWCNREGVAQRRLVESNTDDSRRIFRAKKSSAWLPSEGK